MHIVAMAYAYALQGYLLSLIALNLAMKVETVLRQSRNPNCMPVATMSQVLVFTCTNKLFCTSDFLLKRKKSWAWIKTMYDKLDRAATTQASETLAIKVPNGTHFNKPVFPNLRPLSQAKNHRIHTPKGPTMQPNHSCASLLLLLNSSLNSIPLILHRELSINNTAEATK
ncbi:hypothetical protein EV2_035105 [Malus domestica]